MQPGWRFNFSFKRWWRRVACKLLFIFAWGITLLWLALPTGIFHLCQNCLPPTGVSLSFYSTPKVTLLSLTLSATLCWSLSFFTACLFQYSLKISKLILNFPQILINVKCLLQVQKFTRSLGKNALNVEIRIHSPEWFYMFINLSAYICIIYFICFTVI